MSDNFTLSCCSTVDVPYQYLESRRIPVLFYTYSGILGKTLMPLDIATFILSVLAAFFAIYRLTLSCKASSFSFALWTAVVITGICFLLFTYLPPQIGLFQDPATAP